MATAAARRTRLPDWDSKALRKARREIAALKAGESWASDYPLTYTEFNLLTPDDTFTELFQGVVYMPPAFSEHEKLYMFLIGLLKVYVDAKGLGEVLGSRSAVLLDDYNAPQPDVLFVRRERLHIIRRQEIIAAPDLIMEIVSSDPSRYRALAKMLRYEGFGVPEFWYIDLPRRLARLCHLGKDGKYKASFEGSSGVMASKVVPGFKIRAKWLWSQPGRFPSVYTIVQALLAGRLPR